MTRSFHLQTRHVGALTLVATNKSGGDLAIGDVVVVDTSNSTAVTTTTTAQVTKPIGVVAEPIANNASGHIAIAGWVPLVNVTASVTIGHYAESSTTAKKAAANSSRRSGSFAVFFTSGTTPAAWLFGVPDGSTGGGGGGGSMTVEFLDASSPEGAVDTIRIGNFVVNGAGDVSLLPQISGDGDGMLLFLTGLTELANAAETTGMSIDTGTLYLWVEHTPSDLANEGIALQVGTGYKTLYINQKDGNTIQLHSNNADVELTDDASSDVWRHVDASSVVRDLATMESRKGAGSATVASGSTSVTVTHGAGYTPAAEDIMVTPTNSPTNDPGHWWIDTIGGTTFKINVRANPGVSGATFAWRVDR